VIIFSSRGGTLLTDVRIGSSPCPHHSYWLPRWLGLSTHESNVACCAFKVQSNSFWNVTR